MADQKYELSRRNALIGLGTVGVASAGAGLGTSAFFSDQEEFTGNTIQAGEFSMQADSFVGGVDQDGIGQDQLAFEADEESLIVNSGFDLGDIKPGDTIRLYWWFCIENNPGYVAVAGSSNDENGVEAGNIELDDLWDIDDEADLSTLGEETEATLKTFNSDEDQGKGSELAEVEYSNLNGLLSSLDDGIIVSDEDGPILIGPEPAPYQYILLCLILHVPPGVGNEIQGATTDADLTFYAEQARHNEPEDVRDGAVNAHNDD